MSSKTSILPSYQDQSVIGNGRHHHHHVKSHHHHQHSPTRRKKSRCCGLPRLRHFLYLFLTLLMLCYLTDCIHLYKRISLKKEDGRIHLQTTTYNLRFSIGPIDFSMGTVRRKDMVEINIAPMD